MSFADRFAKLSTGAKLLLILTAAILPIGIALVWIGENGIRQANIALQGRTEDQERAAARSIESLLARNALALRIAAAGAIRDSRADPCADVLQSLATAPAITRSFALRDSAGGLLCAAGGFTPRDPNPMVAPGAIRLWIDPDEKSVIMRVGVVGGMATASVPRDEIRSASLEAGGSILSLNVSDRSNELPVIQTDPPSSRAYNEWPIANGALIIRMGSPKARIATIDRIILLLPVLMWVAAALVSWLLVSGFLIRPLKRLESAVVRYRPGDPSLDLPGNLGPSTEIQELRDAFARAVSRVDQSEREMAGALDGQRRLVREVHHRVKNNLQVVASLLNIHGRSAETDAARGAYAGIARRVGALSVVHRSHFAEIEENRGIALRPLISELAAELRAGAPEAARRLTIDLELETVNTTQDVAVAVAFLVTEIVEFAMLNRPDDSIEISLRRASELTARLTISSPVLNPDETGTPEKVQFERIVAGLAKQLRSTLDRKLGRYSVDLPVFPNS
ncbi:MAG: two-component system, sensor histidine kinase PdtaS [Sphingomonadales bacterium]|nr:two-component system, sensor histidine kinase PdtaS [Sphingomonadales bacterium]